MNDPQGAILRETELEKAERAGDLDMEKAEQVRNAEPVPGHPQGDGTVKRKLKARHLSMIALGGTIGTGLFVGSGKALATGGPLGILLGYSIMGLVVASMMVALGEMATLFPDSGGFIHFATRFVDPAAGFALGYNYWYCYAITLPTELTAASIVIGYWDATTNVAAWIAPLFAAVLIINFMGVRWYGEFEFWFSAIKITAIVGLIIFGVCISAGAAPNGEGAIGFRYWHNPGAFQQYTKGDLVVGGAWGRFLAFWTVLIQAAFSFIGTEIVAVAVGESENPRRTVPKAIKSVFFRIVLFYVLSMFVIGMLVSADDPRLLRGDSTASTSPFVIAIVNAGIKGLPSVVNAVLLVSAWSSGNSVLYAASRVLYSLALEGKAPKIFRRCTKGGLPVYCVAVTGVIGFLAFMSCGSTTAATAFNWLQNISSLSGLITWALILTSYLRFYYGMKTQNRSRDDLPYKAPFQPYFSWFGLVAVIIVILFNGFGVFVARPFEASNFVAAYIGIPIFVVFYVSYKCVGGDRHGKTGWFVWAPTRLVTLEEMDFDSGCRELEEMDAREQLRFAEKKQTIGHKVLNFLF